MIIAVLLIAFIVFGLVVALKERKTSSALVRNNTEVVNLNHVKCNVVPITPQEAMSLEPVDSLRLNQLVSWLNDELPKHFNNHNKSWTVSFSLSRESRKTIDAVQSVFRERGWTVEERVFHNTDKEVQLEFSTTQTVAVRVDVVGDNAITDCDNSEEDELSKKFEDLERQLKEKKS